MGEAMATNKPVGRSSGNKMALIVLGVAIVAVLFMLLGNIMGHSGGSSSNGNSNRVSANAIDSRGRITLAGCYGMDGSQLSTLLKDNGYTYNSTDGYWSKKGGSYLYEFALFDERGNTVSESALKNIKGDVDDNYEIGLYSRTTQNNAYDLNDQKVDARKQKSLSIEGMDATVAIVNGGGERHLAVISLYAYDSYEYEIHSASETLIKERGVSGLSSRTIDSAYDETVSNYS